MEPKFSNHSVIILLISKSQAGTSSFTSLICAAMKETGFKFAQAFSVAESQLLSSSLVLLLSNIFYCLLGNGYCSAVRPNGAGQPKFC